MRNQKLKFDNPKEQALYDKVLGDERLSKLFAPNPEWNNEVNSWIDLVNKCVDWATDNHKVEEWSFSESFLQELSFQLKDVYNYPHEVRFPIISEYFLSL